MSAAMWLEGINLDITPSQQRDLRGLTMADITYCVSPCPFTDCFRHCSQLEELQKQGQKYVNIADLAPVCREYINHVLGEVDNEHS